MKPKDMTKVFPHGTRARYVGMKCRCRRCKFANRSYERKRTKELKAITKNLPQPWKKGRILLGIAKDGAKVWVTMKPHCVGPEGKGCGKAIAVQNKLRLCSECAKKANFKGLVTATRARKHLKALSAKGIGRRAVAAASDVAETVLMQVSSGRKKHIRAETSKRILAVDESCMADSALIDAGPTWAQIHELMEKAKLSKAEISARLGNKVPALQLRKTKVQLKTAHAVGKLHRQVFAELETDPGKPLRDARRLIQRILAEEGMTPRQLANHLGWPNLVMKTYKGCVSSTIWAELQAAHQYFTGGEKEEKVDIICTSCGQSHSKEARLKRLRKALPLEVSMMSERWPCIYPPAEKGNRTAYRDLHDLGAKVVEGPSNGIGATWDIKVGSPSRTTASPPTPSREAEKEGNEDGRRVELEGQEHPGDGRDDAGPRGGGEHPDDLPGQPPGPAVAGEEAGGGGQGQVHEDLGGGGQGDADAPPEAEPGPVGAGR